MKNLIQLIVVVMLLINLVGCHPSEELRPKEEMVVVANRADGSISFINSHNQSVSTLPIPDAEPMYVVYSAAKDLLYIGDRASDKIHIVDPETKLVTGEINVGHGVFHMWADGRGNQLWVNNDIDNTISVVDLDSHTVIKTIDVGSKPHDVFVSIEGTKAYVSVIIPGDTPDKIFMYSTSTFEKTGEVSVGNDPHLFQLPKDDKVYVPCQSGQIYVLDGETLATQSINAYEGAHGIFASSNGKYLFVSNISGNEIYAININDLPKGDPVRRATKTAISTVDVEPSLAATPHNLVVNFAGDRLYVSHSGASANLVSFYTINSDGSLSSGNTVETATNPFGIAYYIR